MRSGGKMITVVEKGSIPLLGEDLSEKWCGNVFIMAWNDETTSSLLQTLDSVVASKPGSMVSGYVMQVCISQAVLGHYNVADTLLLLKPLT
jgi:hypothetical protein